MGQAYGILTNGSQKLKFVEIWYLVARFLRIDNWNEPRIFILNFSLRTLKDMGWKKFDDIGNNLENKWEQYSYP
jgi:hypothetical protein